MSVCWLLLSACSVEKRYHQSGFSVDWHINTQAASSSKTAYHAKQIQPINWVEPTKQKTIVTTSKSEISELKIKPILSDKWVQPIAIKQKRNAITQIVAPLPVPVKTPIANKRLVEEEPIPKQEPFGLIGSLILAFSLFFLFSGVGEVIAYAMPVLIFLTIAFSGYSLGRIKAKPYKYTGAGLAWLTLAFVFGIMLLTYLFIISYARSFPF